jgi:multicomponent Na+:H+ antiporter subunit E
MITTRTNDLRRFVVFLILFSFWLVLSGHYDLFHLSLGVGCSALVSFFSSDLLFKNFSNDRWLLKVWRFLLYVPWLLYQIILANLHVVYLVIRPKQIKPQVVRFKTKLTSNLSQVVLGNSITLTPGTITMDISDGEFCVHALSDKAAREILTGEMEERVARVFLETKHLGDISKF